MPCRPPTPTLFVLCAALFVGFAPRAHGSPEYAPGQLLVKFKAGLASADRAAVESGLGLKTLGDFPFIIVEHMRIENGESVEQANRRPRADPRVEYAEPDFVVHALLTPNDPRFSEMYGLQNTGQTGGTAGADMHAPAERESLS